MMADLSAEPLPLERGPADAAVMYRLFHGARSRNAWSPAPIAPETWRTLYDLLKFGSTSANSSPARFVFVTSEGGPPHAGSAAVGRQSEAPVRALHRHTGL